MTHEKYDTEPGLKWDWYLWLMPINPFSIDDLLTEQKLNQKKGFPSVPVFTIPICDWQGIWSILHLSQIKKLLVNRNTEKLQFITFFIINALAHYCNSTIICPHTQIFKTSHWILCNSLSNHFNLYYYSSIYSHVLSHHEALSALFFSFLYTTHND